MMPRKLLSRTLLAATALTAVVGLYGGLLRFGVPLPDLPPAVDLHGLVMMQGVFGTLVPLERAVALKTSIWFAAPILSGLGTFLLLAGLPVGFLLLVLSAAVFVAMSARVVQLQPTAFNLALLLAAAALLSGTALLPRTGDPLLSMPFWLAFLVLTVSGERLELSRFTGVSRNSSALFMLISTALLIGALPWIRDVDSGMTMALALLAMAGWLAKNDIARRRVRASGQVGFMAAAILCGQFWLAVAGVAMIAQIKFPEMLDVVIHAVGIGFALSMIMGHALIILPAVGGLRLTYRPLMYWALAFLQLSVAARALFDLLAPDLRWTAGSLSLIALLMFGVLGALRPHSSKSAMPGPNDTHSLGADTTSSGRIRPL